MLKRYDREYDPESFIITHKEQQLLKHLRELSDEDINEIEKLTLDLALKDIPENYKTSARCMNTKAEPYRTKPIQCSNHTTYVLYHTRPKIARNLKGRIIMAKAKKLPSGSWRVQATAHGQTKSFTGSDRKTVEAEAKTWQAGIAEETFENITLSKAYERYFSAKEKVLSPSTIRNYKKMHKTNFQSIMNIQINKLTDEHIQLAVNELSAKRSPKTVKNNYGLLTAVLSMFRPNYHPKIQLPQKVKKEIYIPTKDDLKFLLQKSKNTGYYMPI